MKKLLNKKGSVLFLVVVVMSILLVVASATYYIVSNQRQSVEVHYNSEQSYQTAYSVSKTVEDYLTQVHNQISKGTPYESTIFGKIKTLPVDGTMNATKDLEKLGLGKFDVTITKTAENGDEMSFEVTTTSTVNGETSTLVQVWKVKLSAADTKYFTRFLTSTGLGTGTDTFLHVQHIYGSNYFENEFTTIEHPTEQRRSIYSTGTLIDNGITYSDFSDKEVVVAGNYYLDGNDQRPITVKHMLIGGNLEARRSESITAKAVYIMGNMVVEKGFQANDTVFFIQGDCYIKDKVDGNNCKFYIGGNLYYDNNWKSSGELYVDNNVYFKNDNQGDGLGKLVYGGKLYNSAGSEITANQIKCNGSKDAKTFTEAGVDKDITNAMKTASEDQFDGWTSVANYISNETAVGSYQTWDALSFFEPADPTKNKPQGKYFDCPRFDIGQEIETAKSSNLLNKSLTGSTKGSTVERPNYNNEWLVTIKETCKYVKPTGTPADGLRIIIDAEQEDIYIYLDDNGTGEFMFYTNENRPVTVLVKGTHSVIFVLPENITFKMGNKQFIGHYELAKLIANTNQFDDLSQATQQDWLVDGKGPEWSKRLAGENSTDYLLKTVEVDGEQYTFLDDSKFNGAKVHNNIFLVSRGKNSFNFDGLCALAGYIYAPQATLEITPQGNHLKFFGGLIVGGFKYYHQDGHLAFCQPYDQYNGHGAKIVSDLISQASGGVIGDDPGSSGGKKQADITFEGYK